MVAMIAPEWWERGQSVVAAGRRVGEGAARLRPDGRRGSLWWLPAPRWEMGQPKVVGGREVEEGAACCGCRPQGGRGGGLWWERRRQSAVAGGRKILTLWLTFHQ